MAASTITRASLTDGAGGTIWNAAGVNSIVFDAVDALFSGAFNIGGVFTAEGFGTHSMSAGGTGGNILSVRNTTAGTTNYGQVQVGNDGAAAAGIIRHTASTFTATSTYAQDGFHVLGDRAGGLTLSAAHASGTVKVVSNGTTERGRFTSSGLLVGRTTTILSGTGITASGSLQLYAAAGTGVYMLFDDTGGSEDGFAIIGDNGDELRFYDYTAGAGTVRATMTGTGLWRFVDGSESAPALAFTSDADCGFYLNGTGFTPNISVSIGGNQTAMFWRSSFDGGMSAASDTFGTGTATGATVIAGNNTSGSGAAGTLGCVTRGNVLHYIWPDNSATPGVLRIHTARPTENNTTVSDTAGTVVGSQTSCLDQKRLLGRADAQTLLERVRATTLHEFEYRSQWRGERFVGLVTDEAPFFGLDRDAAHPGGRILNEVNAIGALMGAVQALATRLDEIQGAA